MVCETFRMDGCPRFTRAWLCVRKEHPCSTWSRLLAFDPRTARELFAAEGIADLELSLVIPTRPRSKDIAAIVQWQWRENLGVRLKMTDQEETVWEQTIIRKQYRQVIEDSWIARCDDPTAHG